MKEHEDSYSRLIDTLREMRSVAIAFSGGVDSSLLLAAAKDALGAGHVHAYTVHTPFIPAWEVADARTFATKLGIGLDVIVLPIPSAILSNPVNRCYLCKRGVFEVIWQRARAAGYTHLADGTNADDVTDFRPGMKALAELNVCSPLRECGIGKAAIRELSRSLWLPTWNKPAYACLLSRIPYDTPITLDLLHRIEHAERFLMDLGFEHVRVRTHGNLARIEVDHADRAKLLEETMATRITTTLTSLGYTYIAVDIMGYRTGSLNETLNMDNKTKTEFMLPPCSGSPDNGERDISTPHAI